MKIVQLLLLSCIICLGFTSAETNEESLALKYYNLGSTGIVCIKAPCASWYVREIGDKNSKLSIHSLKFDKNINQSVVFNGSYDKDVLHLGYLSYGAVDGQKSITFNIFQSYRVLPLTKEDNATRSGSFYHIDRVFAKCKSEPCPTLAAKELNFGRTQLVISFDNLYTKYGFIDQGWLNNSILQSEQPAKAIVQGVITGSTITAKAIYVNIVDPFRECPPLPIVDCIDKLVPVNTRDVNRCLHTAGCIKPGVCTLSIPICPDGYQLVAFRSKPNGCPHYICDAWFLQKPKQ